HRTLPRGLVRTPPQERRAVAEALTGHLVVNDFGDPFGLQWNPFGATAAAPAALAAGRAASESRLAAQLLEQGQKGLSLSRGERRGISDVEQQSFRIVEAQQE